MYVMSSQHDRSFYGSVEVGLHSVDNSRSTTAIRLYGNQMYYFSQMHMVHMSTKHANVSTAIGDDIGLTVLGVMFEVRSIF